MTAPRGTTEHPCHVCGATVTVAGYPDPDKPIRCREHYMTDLSRAVGERMRERRWDLGVTQETVAERADLHRTYISRVEGGRENPSLATLAKLARALEWPLHELTRLDGSVAVNMSAIRRRPSSFSFPDMEDDDGGDTAND